MSDLTPPWLRALVALADAEEGGRATVELRIYSDGTVDGEMFATLDGELDPYGTRRQRRRATFESFPLDEMPRLVDALRRAEPYTVECQAPQDWRRERNDLRGWQARALAAEAERDTLAAMTEESVRNLDVDTAAVEHAALATKWIAEGLSKPERLRLALLRLWLDVCDVETSRDALAKRADEYEQVAERTAELWREQKAARERAEADARLLAHAYHYDSRPPANVVARALAYPVAPKED